MYWAPFNHGGEQYDLCHLHPRTVTYTQPATGDKPLRDYKVDVIFSLHCFTRGMDDEAHDQALVYSDSREDRIFDFQRYDLSRRLPAIIDGLMTCKCFHSGHGNFFTVTIVDAQGSGIEYEIYFTASKSSKPGIVTLWVQTAYSRDAAHGNRPQKKPIGFPIILFNTLNKIPIREPK